MKEKIIELRKKGLTYNEITKILGISKSTVSYHSSRHGLDGCINCKKVDIKNIDEVNDYYKTHTLDETSEKFEINKTTLKTILNKKRKKLTDEERNAGTYRYVKTFRHKNKERAIEYKGGKCCLCGYNKSKWALDFHHTDSTKKDFTPSSNMNIAWEKLKKELDKCILVCSNCHRELHEKERLVDIHPV